MGITNIFLLLAGVSLFLFGMSLMGEGLKKVAGNKLEVILYKLTSNPIKGILLGTGVTAIIQSSSATSVMVVGFVNSGMMKVKQAIGIIMGAIIGTSITGWIICLSEVNGSGIFEVLSTDNLTAIIAVVGIILLLFTKKDLNHNIANILLGFSVLMFGISTMSDAVYPLRESEAFINLITTFENPIIGILIGLAFTSIIQSASAAVGILQALAVTGAITFKLALPVIMGIAIGASVPVLISALGANASGKRTALIYLLVDTLGAIIFSIIFYSLNGIFKFGFFDIKMNMINIALLNTIFRAIIVVLLTPFISLMEKLVNKLVRENKEEIDELRDVDRLEERFIAFPSLAIEQSRVVINSMANLTHSNLEMSLKLYDKFTQKGFNKACELEEVIDKYEDKLGSYLSQITKKELRSTENRDVRMYLHSINDLERISDHSKNIAEDFKEINDKKIIFSDEAKDEIKTLKNVISEIATTTIDAFTSNDLELAERIEPMEEIIDEICDEYKLNHIERIQKGICDYSHGFVFNDLLTDFERIGDHCSNIGIAIRMNHKEIFEEHAVSKMKMEKSESYQRYYKEYKKKFDLE